jgi:hypothetical protein
MDPTLYGGGLRDAMVGGCDYDNRNHYYGGLDDDSNDDSNDLDNGGTYGSSDVDYVGYSGGMMDDITGGIFGGGETSPLAVALMIVIAAILIWAIWYYMKRDHKKPVKYTHAHVIPQNIVPPVGNRGSLYPIPGSNGGGIRQRFTAGSGISSGGAGSLFGSGMSSMGMGSGLTSSCSKWPAAATSEAQALATANGTDVYSM